MFLLFTVIMPILQIQKNARLKRLAMLVSKVGQKNEFKICVNKCIYHDVSSLFKHTSSVKRKGSESISYFI
jgi:hypothetical protein